MEIRVSGKMPSVILNDYRLLPFQKEAQQIVAKQMEEFFFGDGLAMPEGYTPQKP